MSTKKWTKSLLAVLLCLVIALPAFAATIYVTEEGKSANDGTSWATAKDLATVMSMYQGGAKAGDEVWIKKGTYNIDGKSESFSLRKGVKMYGGFAGTETRLEDRDWRTNRTVLDGKNIARSNGLVTNQRGGTADDTRLDGVVVTGGHKGGPDARNTDGGGVKIEDGSVTLANCEFVGNSVGGGYSKGGGVYANKTGGLLIIENCVFSGNSASVGWLQESDPGSFGGGLYLGDSPTMVINSTFSGNSCEMGEKASLGGAIFVEGANTPLYIVNSTFAGNKAVNGSGIRAVDTPVTIVNSIFWGNEKGIKDISAGTAKVSIKNTAIAADGYAGDSVITEKLITADPQIVSMDIAGKKVVKSSDVYIYHSGGPALGAGLNPGTVIENDVKVPTTDQLGTKRPADRGADLGSWQSDGPVVESITLDKTTLALAPKGTATLKATVTPAAAASVTWISDKPEIASVDTAGKVTAVALGTATITASAGGKNATCAVTVSDGPAPGPVPTDVKMSSTQFSLSVGSSTGLKVVVTPANADTSTEWTTSDATVATVAGGTVTAIKEGKAIITATMTSGGKTATCEVTVTPQSSKPEPKKPTLPAGTPTNITPAEPSVVTTPQNPTPAQKEAAKEAAASTMKGITPADLEVSVHNQVTVKSELAVKRAGDAFPNNPVPLTVLPLPVFTAKPAAAGGIVAIEFVLTGEELKNAAPDKVRVMKITSGDKGQFFTYQSDPTKFDDRTFTVQGMDNEIFKGTFVKTVQYQLILFVKDGAQFDVDAAINTSVTDPTVVVGTGDGSTPTPSPLRGPSSSGGCNAGFGALALLALAPLARRK